MGSSSSANNTLSELIRCKDIEILKLQEEVTKLSEQVGDLQQNMSEVHKLMSYLSTSQVQNNNDINVIYENLKVIVSASDSNDDLFGPFDIKGPNDDDLPN